MPRQADARAGRGRRADGDLLRRGAGQDRGSDLLQLHLFHALHLAARLRDDGFQERGRLSVLLPRHGLGGLHAAGRRLLLQLPQISAQRPHRPDESAARAQHPASGARHRVPDPRGAQEDRQSLRRLRLRIAQLRLSSGESRLRRRSGALHRRSGALPRSGRRGFGQDRFPQDAHRSANKRRDPAAREIRRAGGLAVSAGRGDHRGNRDDGRRRSALARPSRRRASGDHGQRLSGFGPAGALGLRADGRLDGISRNHPRQRRRAPARLLPLRTGRTALDGDSDADQGDLSARSRLRPSLHAGGAEPRRSGLDAAGARRDARRGLPAAERPRRFPGLGARGGRQPHHPRAERPALGQFRLETGPALRSGEGAAQSAADGRGGGAALGSHLPNDRAGPGCSPDAAPLRSRSRPSGAA